MKIIVKIDSSNYPIISNFVVSKMGACRQVLCKMLNLHQNQVENMGASTSIFVIKVGKNEILLAI